MGREVWRRAGLVSVCAAAVIALSGCGDSDAAGAAIDKAARDLRMLALGGGGTSASSDARQREGYTAVLATLRSAEGSASRAGAVGLMSAEAHLGLAGLALGDAIAAEMSAASAEADVRSLQDNWVSLKALEASLRSTDPALEIAELESERTERAAEISAAQQRLSDMKGELAAARARISALEDQARAKWREEGEIRQGAIDQNEVGRAPLIEQANRVKREGDALDRQASDLKAQLASQEPRLRDVEAEIQRLTTQSERLTQAIENLRREHGERQRLAVEVAAEAAQLAEAISRKVTELNSRREKVPGAWAAVASAAEAARGKAGQAARSRGVAEAAQVLTGSAEQMRGDALVQQATGLETYASTMELLGGTRAGEARLPGATEYGSAAGQARQRAGELRQQAASAYEQAASALENAGRGNDQVSQALERLSTQLREKAGVRGTGEGGSEATEESEAAG